MKTLDLRRVLGVLGFALVMALVTPIVESVFRGIARDREWVVAGGVGNAVQALVTEYGSKEAVLSFPMRTDAAFVRLVTTQNPGNPRGIKFLEPRSRDLDGKGAIVDRHGQPFTVERTAEAIVVRSSAGEVRFDSNKSNQ